MPDETAYVCHSATLDCKHGTGTCSLVVLPVRTVFLTGRRRANILDFSPANITTFKMCKSPKNPLVIAAQGAPVPCTPICKPWIGGKADVLVQGAPGLLTNAKTICMLGLGVIKIKSSGQGGADNSNPDGADEKHVNPSAERKTLTVLDNPDSDKSDVATLRADDGQSSGNGENIIIETIILETVDFNDKALVQSTLEKYEQEIVGLDHEVMIVIAKDGTVYRSTIYKKDEVYPPENVDLSGAYVTHNHPVGEGEHTFSDNDYRMFRNKDLEVLRGIEEKYVYEIRKNTGDSPEYYIPTTGYINEENFAHSMFINRVADEEDIYYERNERRT